MKYSEIQYPSPDYGVPSSLPSALRGPIDPESDPGICDHGCGLFVADPLMLEAEIEGIKAMRSLLGESMEGERQEANFIVDVFVMHNKPNVNTAIPNNEKIPYRQCRTAVESLHLALRNQGHHYRENGVDTKINCGLGEVTYINGHDVWGDLWDHGIRYGDSDGVGSSTVIEYCKKHIGTWQDPTRYAIIVYPKLSASGTVAGFAYVGVNATNRVAGQFVRWSHCGDKHPDLLREGEAPFSLSIQAGNNKTVIHEFGHSMGFYHTFHNTDSCDEEPHSLQGDRVSDTRIHTRYDTCNYTKYENPRDNHMSYTFADFRVVFTIGQWVERGWLVLENSYSQMFNNPFYDWGHEPQPIVGCMDEQADNFNPEATEPCEDCCEYPPLVMPEIIEFEQTESGDESEFVVRIKNTETIKVVVTNENGSVMQEKEVGIVDPPSNLVAEFLPSNFDDEFGWKDSVSNTYTETKGAQKGVDENGEYVSFDRTDSWCELTGLLIGDYTIEAEFKLEGEIDNIRSLILKRNGWQNENSKLALFLLGGNELNWDNTKTSNRINTGYVPKSGEVFHLQASRDLGLFINGEILAGPGDYDPNVVNNFVLSIGGDRTEPSRGLGGKVYFVKLYNESLAQGLL